MDDLKLPEKGEVWWHPKTGGEYEIIGLSIDVTTGDLCVVYASSLMIFHRPLGEFLGHDPELKQRRYKLLRGADGKAHR